MTRLKQKRWPTLFPPICCAGLLIAVSGTALAEGGRRNAYRQCIAAPALEYREAWKSRCLNFAGKMNCDLPDEATTDIEDDYRLKRLQCLDRIRTAEPEPWEQMERLSLADPYMPLPIPNPPEGRLVDWALATLIVSGCIIGILHQLRKRKPDKT